MKLSRREFLFTNLMWGATFVWGKSKAWAASTPSQEDIKRILAVVHGEDPEQMVRKTIEILGGIKRFVFPGSSIVVKPNASFANPADWGNNTNPKVVAAVCKLCREAGARKVTVVDYPLLRGEEALRLNGMAEACQGINGVSLRVLGQSHQFRNVAVPQGVALREVAVAREVLDADLLINVPVAKAHDAVAASIGLKNLMGIIWDRSVFHTMMDIHQAIVDLSRVVRPGLTLVDMTKVMTTNGPKGPGEVATPQLIVAGIDPVAADSYALSQVRFNGRQFKPKQLRYLQYANAAGLGEIDPGKLSIQKEEV